MEKSVLDNANPTILNVSQLPSRRQKQAALRRGPESKYDDVLFPPSPTESWHSFSDASSWLSSASEDDSELSEEPIDEQEIYDLISTISDPEHPYTLGQLSIVNIPDIHITPSGQAGQNSLMTVLVEITPTVTHCSLATVLGLAVRVRLEQALPPNYRVDIRMKKGTQAQDDQVNKQLADKERVAAALENDSLKGVLDKMLLTCV